MIKSLLIFFFEFDIKDDILLIKLEKCHYKGKNKIPCKSLCQISPRNAKDHFWSEFLIIDLKVLLNVLNQEHKRS